MVAFKDVGPTLVIIVADLGAGRSDDDDISLDSHSATKPIVGCTIVRNQLSHLAPIVSSTLVAFKDVGCALPTVAIDVGKMRPDDSTITVRADGHGPAEFIAGRSIGGDQLGNLAPATGSILGTVKDVSCALTTVSGYRGPIRSDEDRIPTYSYGTAELIKGYAVGGNKFGALAARQSSAGQSDGQDPPEEKVTYPAKA
jgi:hypothetical protein